MALTNTLVNNVCHASLDAAKDAYFSAMPIPYATSATDSFRIVFNKVDGNWTQIKQSWNSSGTYSQVYSLSASAPTFPQCDATQPYFDGMQIGWGVVAAMASVAGVIFLKRALFS